MNKRYSLKSAYNGVEHFALEADGYKIAKIAFGDKDGEKSCWFRVFEDFRGYFYFGRDLLLLRTALFALQRGLGKWGGEQTPEYDREFSMFYLLYLATYRHELPSVFVGRFIKREERLTKEERELVAGMVRREFMVGYRSQIAPFDWEVENCLTADHAGIISKMDTELRNRPEVILAMSFNVPVLATAIYTSDCTDIQAQGIKDIRNNMDIVFEIETALWELCDTARFASDDHMNALMMFFLQARLIRNPALVKDGSVEYSMLMFLYLELYRREFLPCFTVEPFVSQWKALPKSAKEDTAELFRKRLSLAREKFQKQAEEEYANAHKK